jgi:transcriptional antiterminator RfaH
MLRWYLIHTKPRAEPIARSNLERQGYEVYFPRLAHTVRRGQYWNQHVGPLFPRYLFLRVDVGEQALVPVHSTLGVSSIVRFGSRYSVVPDEVVEALRSDADPLSGLHRLRRPARIAAGSRIRMVEGPFEGLEGVLERADGDERVLVLLTVLGQEARVSVCTEDVVASHAA